MKHNHSIPFAAMLARHLPGGSAEASTAGPRLALASVVLLWERRSRPL